MATLQWTDGKLYEVPDDKVQQAYRDGFKPADPTRVAATDQTGLAALEGVGRGITAGLAEPLLIDLQSRLTGKARSQIAAEKKARREENPVASTVGEIGGAIGTSLVTGGGVSALAGGGIRGAAVEGGVYGLGSMVNEAALENKPVAVDSLAAGMVGGALMGGGVAAGFGLIGKGVSAGMSKLGGVALKDTLKSAADEVKWRSFMDPGTRLEKKSLPYKKELLKYADEQGIFSTPDLIASSDRAQAVVEANAPRIGQWVTDLEGYVPLKGDAALRNETIDTLKKGLESKFGGRPVYKESLKTAQGMLEDLRADKNLTWGDVWDFQSTLFNDIDKNATISAPKEVREQLREDIRRFAFDEIASGKNKAGKVLTAAGTWEKKTPTTIRQEGFEAYSDPEFVAAGERFYKPQTVELDNAGPRPAQDTGAALFPGKIRLPETPNPEFRAAPFAAEGREFYLPQQSATQALTVRLGEEATIPGMELSGLMVPGAPRTARPPVRGQSIKAPATVVIGGVEDAASGGGGFVLNLPAKATPVNFGAEGRRLGQEAAMAFTLAKALGTKADKLRKSGGPLGIGNINPFSYGGMVGLATANPLAAVATSVADQQLRRRGGLLTASVLRSLGESNITPGIAKNLTSHIQKIMTVAPEVLGAYRFPLAQAAAMGSDELLQEHLRLAASPQGEHYAATLGLPLENEKEVEVAGQKIAVLDALDVAARTVQQDMDTSVGAMFGAAPGRKGSIGGTISAKDFGKTLEGIRALASDPEKAFAQVPPELYVAAPGVAAEAAARVLAAAQFLEARAPKNPNPLPKSVATPWVPDAASLDRWNRYKEAVEQPARVLKSMSQGYAPPEYVEAIRAVYPALYADLQQKIGERLAAWDKPLTYKQKLVLSQWVGPNALGLKAQQVVVLQQAQMGSAGKQQNGGGMSKPDGRQTVDQQKNLQTQSQRLEAR